MTLKNNRAHLLYYFKLCASFGSHWRIQTGVTVRKRPIWVKKNDDFFLAVWPWNLKNNRTPLLSNSKLFASFHHHMWIQTEVTVRKRLSWVLTYVTLTFDLWPWPFAWTSLLSMVITPENFMMIQWQEHCEKGVTDGRTETDGRTDWSVLRAAWSQLKVISIINVKSTPKLLILADEIISIIWATVSCRPKTKGSMFRRQSLLQDITVTSHDRHGDSAHRQLHCLFSDFFGCTSKKTPKLRVTGTLCEESTGDRWIHKGFVTQKTFPCGDHEHIRLYRPRDGPANSNSLKNKNVDSHADYFRALRVAVLTDFIQCY